jgi:hypothetical protein
MICGFIKRQEFNQPSSYQFLKDCAPWSQSVSQLTLKEEQISDVWKQSSEESTWTWESNQ